MLSDTAMQCETEFTQEYGIFAIGLLYTSPGGMPRKINTDPGK
jgi:hypothetical protein